MACSDSSSSFSNGPTAAAPSSAPTLLVVTGLSGAGKSTALQGTGRRRLFYRRRSAPGSAAEFLNLARKPDMEHFRGLALGMDFRRGATIQTLSEALGHLRAAGTHPALLFLEARPEVILRRYATSRRPHPVEREGLGLEQAVAEERRRLTPVREAADLVLEHLGLHSARSAPRNSTPLEPGPRAGARHARASGQLRLQIRGTQRCGHGV